MKKKILFILITIGLGMFVTFSFLNKKSIYAKEKYLVYAFQVGAFKNEDNASKLASKMPSGIYIKDNDLYKVYVGIYKDIDLLNKMLVYYENNGINIYLKTINVEKKFYDKLDYYEKIIINTEDKNIYKKTNDEILELYKESVNND